jgi:hypothetical protein
LLEKVFKKEEDEVVIKESLPALRQTLHINSKILSEILLQ